MRPHRFKRSLAPLAAAAFAALPLLYMLPADAQVKGAKPGKAGKAGAKAPPSASASATASAPSSPPAPMPAATTTVSDAPATTIEAPPPTAAPAALPDPDDPHEEAGKTYYFVGLRYRHTYLPPFMLHIFVDGGPSGGVSLPSAGAEFTMRKDGFDTTFSISYADYSMKPFPFKGKSEDDSAWELVDSSLKILQFAVDLMWSTEISNKFRFTYGATTGIGVVFGDLRRTWLHPPNGNAPSDPYTYVPCNGPKDPPGSGAYCNRPNNHYGDYNDASWFNGGKKPNFYPLFGPEIGLRFKPIKQFVANADVGFNIFSGFFFGVRASYGL